MEHILSLVCRLAMPPGLLLLLTYSEGPAAAREEGTVSEVDRTPVKGGKGR